MFVSFVMTPWTILNYWRNRKVSCMNDFARCWSTDGHGVAVLLPAGWLLLIVWPQGIASSLMASRGLDMVTGDQSGNHQLCFVESLQDRQSMGLITSRWCWHNARRSEIICQPILGFLGILEAKIFAVSPSLIPGIILIVGRLWSL